MKTNTLYIISIGGIFSVIGIGLGLIMNQLLIPQILTVLGIELIVLESMRRYIFKKSSLKTLGISILLFSILNFLRHSTFFIVVSKIGELYNDDPAFIAFLVRETFWLIFSTWILSRGINLFRISDVTTFDKYINSKEFKLLLIVVIILLLLEIPIFGIHPDFAGGLHGHSFWDGGTHLH